ncbi:glycosyltransferase [Providencia manganoxydans]|uniref:glycosyltransferase family 4 protein n=1 Tax=Providencia manganoxydans TaxID=2923283 RepID=UPI0032DBA84E
MNILMLLGYFRTSSYNGAVGGGEMSNIDLATKLVELGNNVTTITLFSNLENESYYKGVKVYKIKSVSESIPFKVLGWLNYKKTTDSIMSNQKYDVIICGPDTVGLASELSLKYRIKAGCFVRAYENFDNYPSKKIKNKIKLKLKRLLFGDNSLKTLKEMDFILTNSKYMKLFCRNQNLTQKIKVIYPALSFKYIVPVENKVIKNITMVGTGIHKGNFIAEELANIYPEINFNILGCPEHLRKRNDLINLNYIDWCDVINFFRENTDVVIVPSEWEEPFGRVAIEGLACGNITLVSNRGGLPETVANINELIVMSNNIHAWNEKIDDVINNQLKYVNLSNKAQKLLHEYSPERQAIKLQDFLRIKTNIF